MIRMHINRDRHTKKFNVRVVNVVILQDCHTVVNNRSQFSTGLLQVLDKCFEIIFAVILP